MCAAVLHAGAEKQLYRFTAGPGTLTDIYARKTKGKKQMNKTPDETKIDARRKKILEMLDRDKKVRVAELSELFGISEVTIRLDLTEMEKNGLLERVHGGAVSTNKLYYKMDFNERLNYYSESGKLDIARAAAGLIKPYDTLMINSGTVAYMIARELKKLEALTVVTNSFPIAQELSGLAGFNVILLGGTITLNTSIHTATTRSSSSANTRRASLF